MTPRPFISLLIVAATAISAAPQSRRTVALNNASTGTTASAFLYEEVDIHPSFPGGDRELYRFINSHRRYPAKAYAAGIEGRVVCSFVVGSDGTISHVEVVKGVESTLDAEACRIISSMPRWTPGIVDDTPVATFCLLPVPFRK